MYSYRSVFLFLSDIMVTDVYMFGTPVVLKVI